MEVIQKRNPFPTNIVHLIFPTLDASKPNNESQRQYYITACSIPMYVKEDYGIYLQFWLFELKAQGTTQIAFSVSRNCFVLWLRRLSFVSVQSLHYHSLSNGITGSETRTSSLNFLSNCTTRYRQKDASSTSFAAPSSRCCFCCRRGHDQNHWRCNE